MTHVILALAADEPATRAVATALFPQAERHCLTRAELRPSQPFLGALFDLLGAVPAGSCVGLVVPVRFLGGEPARAVPPSGRPAAPLLAVTDHLNLTLASPLAGRWPADRPRTFPAVTDIYQPDITRTCGGARVYWADIVAGVTDAGRLTPFEAAALRDEGYAAVSDTLVPAAIVAAYFGLTLAACGVPQAQDCEQGQGSRDFQL